MVYRLLRLSEFRIVRFGAHFRFALKVHFEFAQMLHLEQVELCLNLIFRLNIKYQLLNFEQCGKIPM